jgi:hypothetical protein
LLLAAAIFVVWELAGRRLPWPAALTWPRLPQWVAPVAGLTLVVAYAAQLALLVFQAGHDGVRPAWFGDFPLRFVDDAYAFGPLHGAISLAALALALAQSAALIALLANTALQTQAPRVPGAGAGAAGASAAGAKAADSSAGRVAPYVFGALALLSVGAPVVSSGDVFGYVGLGMLGGQAYFRPAGFFSGEFARVFAHYPIRPTIYGPLWVALNSTLVALGSGFLGKIVALRLFGAVALGLLVWLARALGAPRAAVYALALNPMLWFQFVANAHNDLPAIALLVGATLLLARQRPTWAVGLVAAAGLIKFPFLLLGVVAFARLPLRPRLTYAAAAVAVCVVLSAIFGGQPYLDALLHTARSRGAAWDPLVTGSKAALGLAVLTVTGMALARGRFLAFGGWLYPALAPVLFPWYFVWALPYAFAAGTGLTATLLALPLVATLGDTIYALDAVALVVPFGALALLVLALRPNGRTYLRAG